MSYYTNILLIIIINIQLLIVSNHLLNARSSAVLYTAVETAESSEAEIEEFQEDQIRDKPILLDANILMYKFFISHLSILSQPTTEMDIPPEA